tara:strand:+ start:858 stop:1664 length:807 start_codon:yes stop_codon:yes gene_type:complete
LQLSSLRDYCRAVVDIDTTDITNATLNEFIREGYDLIVYSEKRWPFYEVALTFDTADGKKDYTMAEISTDMSITHDGVPFTGGSAPTNLSLREIAAIKTDRHVLEYIGYEVGDIIYPLNRVPGGTPYYFSMWNQGGSASAAVSGQSVRLYPTPTGVETLYVRAYRNAVDFAGQTPIYRSAIADADTPDLPEAFDPVLSLYVIYRCYQQQEDAGMGQQYYAQFISELENLRARFEDTPAPQPVLLNSVSASRWRSNSILPNRLRYSWEW